MTWKSPNCAAVCLTALNTSSRFDTSALIAIAFVPSLDNLSAAAFAPSSLKSTTATLKPSSTKRSAILKPIPCAPPVTNATLLFVIKITPQISFL